MTTAVTIPHVLGEATLGELEQHVRGHSSAPKVTGMTRRAIESAANRLDATAASVSMTIVALVPSRLALNRPATHWRQRVRAGR
jgi:hypothetical protein